MAPLILGYWDLRGLAESVKLLLEHVGKEYEMKIYHFGPEPDFDRSEWTNVKSNLDMDFPNLPYIIDGDVKLPQSMAIMRYIARQHDMMPVTEVEQQRVDVIQAQYMDYVMQAGMVWYNPKYEEMKDELITALQERMVALSKFLGGHEFFAGSRLTYIDFAIYEFLDKLKLFKGDILNATPNLKSFQATIERLPNIKSYLASDRFQKWPLNGPMASWGGARDPCPQ